MAVTQFGGPEVLRMTEMPQPQPGEWDLLIEVHAAAINPVDFKIRKGAFGKGRKFPFILGFDVSGVVRDMGARAEGFNIGDEIYASPNLLRDGADAEYVCVDARSAAHKPRTLSYIQAAALPLVTISAWEALYERTRVQSGETILIHAGGGGAGHVTIQLAKARGCRVLTTASRAESIDLCRKLGADGVIDYGREDVVKRVMEETDGAGCPVVFDCVGGEVFDQSIRCLAAWGRLVTIVGAHSAEVMKELFIRSATVHFEFMGAYSVWNKGFEAQGRLLRSAAELVDAGRLMPHVGRIISLPELAEGHKIQETGHATGKIVVKVR